MNPSSETFVPDTDPILDTTPQYRAHTLNAYNHMRRLILPIYPSLAVEPLSNTQDQIIQTRRIPDLLLTNVPKSQMSSHQREHRQMYSCDPTFSFQAHYIPRQYPISSFMNSVHEQFFVTLANRWKIDPTTIDVNLARLQKIAREKQLFFTIEELPLVLELYLQIDVDMFHWKTCSIFDPFSTPYDAIFDNHDDLPTPRFGIEKCKQQDCYCCNFTLTRRRIVAAYSLQFYMTRIHTFVYGYQAILNASLNCTTTNIIYVITCLCKQADFVAHTDQSLVDCLIQHRLQAQRVVCEYLFGDTVIKHLQSEKSNEQSQTPPINSKYQHLYEHISHCMKCLQVFLDANPVYWCFVPMVKHDDRNYLLETKTKLSECKPPIRCRSDEFVETLIHTLPTPSSSYFFTPTQQEQQRLFFQFGYDRRLCSKNTVDLFDMEVILRLPSCSTTVKQFVESLFITHTECSLNNHGHFMIFDQQRRRRRRPVSFLEASWEDLLDRPLNITFKDE